MIALPESTPVNADRKLSDLPDPFVHALAHAIHKGLVRDHYVRLHRFGTFRLKWTRATSYRHAKSGKTIQRSPQPRIYFSPAAHLREQVIYLTTRQEHITPDFTAQSIPRRNSLIYKQQPDSNTSTLSSHVSVASPVINETKNKHEGFSRHISILAAILAAIPITLSLLDKAVNTTAPEHLRGIQSTINPDTTTIPHDQTQGIPEPRPPQPVYLQPTIHTVQNNDSLWDLAAKYYNAPLLWPYIYRANKRKIRHPDRILTTQQLVIPGLHNPASKLHPIDRKLVAQGYLMLYRYFSRRGDSQSYNFLIGALQFDKECCKKSPH